MIKGIIGTVIGDIAGSTHEGKPVKTMRFDTLNKQSTVTDDTVLTMAVAEWMLDRKHVSVSDSLIKWATLYPHAGYGSSFKRFLAEKKMMTPGSTHNGAAMRVSSVGFLADSLEECLALADESARPSHGSPQAVAAAQATAAAIYLARSGSTKAEIRDYISDKFGYDLSRPYDQVRADVLHARATKHIDYETSHERIVGAEQSGDDLLVDAADDGGVDHAVVKAGLHDLHGGGHVGNGAGQNDLVLAGAGGMSLHQTDACALEGGIGSLDALGNALQFNDTNSLIHSYLPLSIMRESRLSWRPRR